MEISEELPPVTNSDVFCEELQIMLEQLEKKRVGEGKKYEEQIAVLKEQNEGLRMELIQSVESLEKALNRDEEAWKQWNEESIASKWKDQESGLRIRIGELEEEVRLANLNAEKKTFEWEQGFKERMELEKRIQALTLQLNGGVAPVSVPPKSPRGRFASTPSQKFTKMIDTSDSSDAMEKHVRQLEQDKAEAHRQHEELTEALQQARQSAERQKESFMNVTEVLTRREKEIQSLETALETKLQQAEEQYGLKNAERLKEEIRLQEQVSSLQSELQECRSEMEDVRLERANLEKEMTTLVQQHDLEVRTLRKDKEAEMRMFFQKVEGLEEQVTSLQSALQEREAVVNALRLEKANLDKEMTDIRTLQEGKEKEVVRLESELQLLQSSLDTVNVQLEEAKRHQPPDNGEETRLQLAKAKAEIGRHERWEKEREQQFEQIIKDKADDQKKIEDLDKELVQLKLELEALSTARSKKMGDDLVRLRSQKEEVVRGLEQEKTRLEGALAKSTATISILEGEREKFRSLLDNTQRALSEVTLKLETQAGQFQQLEDQERIREQQRKLSANNNSKSNRGKWAFVFMIVFLLLVRALIAPLIVIDRRLP